MCCSPLCLVQNTNNLHSFRHLISSLFNILFEIRHEFICIYVFLVQLCIIFWTIINVDVIFEDIDECQTDNDCVEHANCVNTVGAYRCECEEGYRGNGKIECAGKHPYMCWSTRPIWWQMLTMFQQDSCIHLMFLL